MPPHLSANGISPIGSKPGTPHPFEGEPVCIFFCLHVRGLLNLSTNAPLPFCLCCDKTLKSGACCPISNANAVAAAAAAATSPASLMGAGGLDGEWMDLI